MVVQHAGRTDVTPCTSRLLWASFLKLRCCALALFGPQISVGKQLKSLIDMSDNTKIGFSVFVSHTRRRLAHLCHWLPVPGSLHDVGRYSRLTGF
jgi:hypothetical protein